MITVIKQKPHKYTIKCGHCDCVFSYELSDMQKDYYGQYKVVCPCCNEKQLHSEREREN